MEEKRDFKGVWIPKEVWLDSRLSALTKVILVEIDSLDNGERGCYASNEALASFCQCSVTKVSLAIKDLIKYGYIYVSNFDGRHRELKSRLSKSERQTYNFSKADIQKVNANNINNNTDININDNIKNNKKEIEEIISYLNDKIGTRYRTNSKTTNEHINARLQEGFTVDDFKTVIDKKYNQWYNDKTMNQYLRPLTLFGTKFEGYLNEISDNKGDTHKTTFSNETSRKPDWSQYKIAQVPDTAKTQKDVCKFLGECKNNDMYTQGYTEEMSWVISDEVLRSIGITYEEYKALPME